MFLYKEKCIFQGGIQMKNMMKKFLSVVLVLSLLGVSQMGIPFAFDAEAATHTGECGTALVWSLDTLTGVLEISGTGDMDNWTTSDYPSWRSYKSSIRTVNITNGVTSIGDYAFYNYDSLSVVNIPASVTSIAEFAFNDCDNLKSITVDENNTYYSSDENGVLFNEGKTELIQYPANNTNTSYQIPYFVMGLIVSSLATMFAEMYVPQIANTAGVYLPLMAASSAAALRCENFAVKKSIRLSFYDAAANGIGTSLVLLFTGFVRGLLGVGTIGEFVVFEKAPISGLSMPFGGFIMLGFSAALLKWFISTFLSDYSHDMSFGIKRAKKKRPPARKTPAPIKKSKPVKKNDVASQPVEVNEPVTEQEEPVTEEPVTETVDQTLITDEFDLFNFSVDDEIDAIMSGLSSFDSILDEISKEKEDSENE